MHDRVRLTRSQIAYVDSCLAMFGYQHDPKAIEPVRKREGVVFKRRQLKRMVLDIRREANTPLTNREIAAQVIACLGWDQADATLLKSVVYRVKDVTKGLARAPLSA